MFAEDLTPAQFKAWWGAYLPSALQIITYNGNGLNAGGDAVRLWNDSVESNPPIASVSFGSAATGVSFTYNPASQTFGELSQVGEDGAIQGGSAADIGSPGRILAPVVSPQLQAALTTGFMHIEFDAALGRTYSLESRSDIAITEWSPTGDTFYATNNVRTFFEKEAAATLRFYRVRAE